MKTTFYNPSPLEKEIANALISVQKEIEKHLKDYTLSEAFVDLELDNPSVKFSLLDKEGNHHEVVIKIVQIPDTSEQ